ncbi:MAG: hypothetical protein C0422_13650 [Alcaligenaceae bacterium]|nr:hypothetical protein [Alcaligenaceae bacterium]
MSGVRDSVVCWVLVNCSFYHIARWSAFSDLSMAKSYVLELSSNDIGMKELTADIKTRFHRRSIYGHVMPAKVSQLNLFRKVFTSLDEISPSIVFVNGWAHTISIASMLWAVANKKRIVLFTESNRHDFQRSFFKELIKRIYLKSIDAAVCGGRLSEEYLVSLGMNKVRIFPGYNVVDNSHFDLYRKNKSQLRPAWISEIVGQSRYFLSVGRLEAKKNHHTLIRAFSIFKTNCLESYDVKLIIAGAGELMADLKNLIVLEKLEKDVFLIGGVNYERLPELYSNSFCFVHPSSTEQWGLVVNEAMASALPVLVSDRCGCVPELVHSGVNGFAFDSSDVKDISGILCRFSNLTAVEIERFGKKSRRIIDDYSPVKFADGCVNASVSALSCRNKSKFFTFYNRIIGSILSGFFGVFFFVYGLFYNESR